MDGLDLEKFFLWVFVVTIFFKGLIYKFGARKKIPACPLDKQFSHFACLGNYFIASVVPLIMYKMVQ